LVRRETELTQKQAQQILGDLYMARTAKIAITSVFCVIGALLLILSIIMYRKNKALGNLQAIDHYSDNQTEEEGLLPGQKVERRQIKI
jgi:hypothetical protein